eukprot:6315588-Prymnesium_polylepis.1
MQSCGHVGAQMPRTTVLTPHGRCGPTPAWYVTARHTRGTPHPAPHPPRCGAPRKSLPAPALSPDRHPTTSLLPHSCSSIRALVQV